MSAVQEIFDYLKASKLFYLATVEGDQPRVRPMGAIDVFEDRLYFQTGNIKNVFQQMKANPKVEICTMGPEGTWIRIQANAIQDDRLEAREHMMDANPGLKNRYAADDGICEVLYLENAKAVIASFTAEPKVIEF
ncbi:pyridoxamine 5'-phosphate oxidase family protein [Alkalibacter rhizosphaerae]|uniref:Pyridoxamine 5'-phosphate oxidase family protein n=1 Tax=Alkalibacter rhizosphaerae TaxID=2815577 RepID=A0A975AI63_9FIRM|nr:pyridoxamine 5'-phosphate oxidase family protein [Alkalibacter rhizosphaerae]QSX09142.1 pyridoxamine 5'-phosphate oxidase family protein [Alkalibacter rhizosphaerae]